MENYMNWVNNHFTEANNNQYLEMYRLADRLTKDFLDKGFDTVWYHEEGKDKQMCISFMRNGGIVYMTFNQDTQKWGLDCQETVIDKQRS